MAAPHKRETVAIDAIDPAPYNPRKIDDAAKAALAHSIDEFGIVQDIVCNIRDRRIIGGHQRYYILKEKGEKTVPVTWVDLTEEREKALNIALNSPLLAGVFTSDLDALLDELAEKESQLFEELLLGELSIDRILAEGRPVEFQTFDESIETEHVCPSCGFRFSGGKTEAVKSE